MRLCGVLHLDNGSNGILDPLTKNLVLMFSLNPVRYPICKTTRAIVRDSKASCANTAVYNKGDAVRPDAQQACFGGIAKIRVKRANHGGNHGWRFVRCVAGFGQFPAMHLTIWSGYSAPEGFSELNQFDSGFSH